MNLQIGYDEISSYISSKYGKNVSIEYVDLHTATVKASLKVLLVNLTIPLTIHIDEVTTESITLTYSGKLGIDKVANSVISFLTNSIEDIKNILHVDNQTITIRLCNIKELKTTLDIIKLDDITFDQTGIDVTASLK